MGYKVVVLKAGSRLSWFMAIARFSQGLLQGQYLLSGGGIHDSIYSSRI